MRDIGAGDAAAAMAEGTSMRSGCAAAPGTAPWNFFLVTFGCKVNQYETEAVREAWTGQGGVECRDPALADVILVNSCAITGRAERDARNALVRLGREAPGALLLLTGCAARLVADFAPRRGTPRPFADGVVVQERKEDLCRPDHVRALLGRARALRERGREGGVMEAAPMRPRDLAGRPWPALEIADFGRSRPVLKVQDGCTHRCTYCIVPYTRGPHVSRPPEDVCAEAARLLENHAELMISGVNLGQYGRDHPEYGGFWDLLERLEETLAPRFAGRRRLRVSSLEPSQLDERGCRVLARSRLVAPHLHVSLQHAAPGVLRRMGRGHYSASDLTRALERIHDAWPVMGLGADILVGFPGETAADVDALCRFIEETPFSYAHVFPYSRRPGTPAAGFPGQLTRAEKAARAQAVRQVVAGRARAFWERQAREPFLDIVLDACEGALVPGRVHGVAACYTPCWLGAGELAGLGPGAGRKDPIRVRPAGVCERGVLDEPLARAGGR